LFFHPVDFSDEGPSSVLPSAPRDCTFQLKLLLWNTLSEIEVVRRFPDHMGIDPTFKTNGRSFPWVFIVGQDANGKTVLWGSSILGDGELPENFVWLVYVGLGSIYGDKIMLAVALSTSDGDAKIYNPIRSLIDQGKLGGTLARCFWHGVTKPYSSVLAGAPEEEKKLHLPIQRAMSVALRKCTESATEVKEVFQACSKYISRMRAERRGCDSRWAAALEYLSDVEALWPLIVWFRLGYSEAERLAGMKEKMLRSRKIQMCTQRQN